LYVFTRDPGEEAWGCQAAIMMGLFSIIPLVLDLVMKVLQLKERKSCLLIQIPISVIIFALHWKWSLINI
jgi:hypothetical protein